MVLISFAQISLLPYFSYKYGISMFPLACIIGACSVKSLSLPGLNKIKRQLTIALLSLILFVYAASGFITVFNKNSDLLEIQDWRGAGKYLSMHVNKRDMLFFVQSWRYSSLEYYFKTPSELCLVNDYKQLIEKVKVLLKEKHLGKEQIQHRRFWVVLSSLENRSALIEKFFGDKKIPAKEKAELIVQRLKKNLRIESIDTLHFKRVSTVQFIVKS